MSNVPKIGMRIVKSALAVFICFCIYLLRGTGMPFYSAIAAILCMQQDVKTSWKVGLNRAIGTLVGGTAGMLVLVLIQELGLGETSVWRYAIVSVVIVPLMYITVLVHKTTATDITCVVFLSIAISHGMDVAPIVFAVNRVIDTFIGIGVAMLVNLIPPRKKLALAVEKAEEAEAVGEDDKQSPCCGR